MFWRGNRKSGCSPAHSVASNHKSHRQPTMYNFIDAKQILFLARVASPQATKGLIRAYAMLTGRSVSLSLPLLHYWRSWYLTSCRRGVIPSKFVGEVGWCPQGVCYSSNQDEGNAWICSNPNVTFHCFNRVFHCVCSGAGLGGREPALGVALSRHMPRPERVRFRNGPVTGCPTQRLQSLHSSTDQTSMLRVVSGRNSISD